MSRFTLPGALLALLLFAAPLGACGEDEEPGEPGCCQLTERKCAESPPMTPKNCQSLQGDFYPGLACNTDSQTCE